MGRALLKALTCGIAGALAWVLCEPFFPKLVPLGNWTADPAFVRVELIFTCLLGAFIGVASGFLNGVERGGKTNIVIAAVLGLVFGAMGSSFGRTIAGGIYFSMGGGPNTNVLARTVAFLPLGMFMGAAVGASQRSFRAVKSGALGGLLAGFITGAVFDVLSNMLSSLVTPFNAANIPAGFQPEGGAPGRALMAFGMGLLIGLFTALVDMATRRAWLRLVLGRNEGKEWPIDAGQTLIGRDERAHVPLFGDPQIPSLAAVIVKQGNSYILQDPGSPIGVGHNGVRVPQAQLSSGDTIQIGNLNFQFMMKSGHAGAHEGRAKAVPVGGPGYPQQPQPQPFSQQAPAPPQYQQQPTQLPYGGQPGPQQTIAYTQQPVQPAPQQTMAYQSPQAMTAPVGPGLVVMSGPMTGQRIAVTGPLDIGREGSGLAIGYDAQASRRHANVAPGPGGIQITDLGSTNGTFVNGQRIPSAVLRPGDTVTIGSTSFRVE